MVKPPRCGVFEAYSAEAYIICEAPTWLMSPHVGFPKPQPNALQEYDQMAENKTHIPVFKLSSMVEAPASDPLPTELLEKILAFVAPELPEYADVEVTPQQTIEPPETFISAQSALFNMCLASSRLDGLARPLLFRTIVIWKADSLVLLWRTLIRHPNLGSLIHQIACWMTLTRDIVIRHTVQAVEEKLGLSASPRDQRIHEDIRKIVQDDVPQAIIFDMLCRMTHLLTLSLQVPRTAEQIDYSYLIKIIANSRHLGGTSTPPMTFNHNHAPALSCSPATLQLCLDPCLPAALNSRADEIEDMGFDHQDYWPLCGISGLVRLHCWGDDGSRGFGFLIEEDSTVGLGTLPDGYLEGIREIRLDLSSSGPQSLYSLCQSAPQLETLRVSHRRHSQKPGFWGQFHPKNLNNGLLMRAATLRHLHLDFYDSMENKYSIGLDQKLTCLPELCHLETLQIQLQTLFGRRSAIPRHHIENIFPRSLVELTLDDEWDQDVIETEERTQLYSGNMDPEEFQGGWVINPDREAGFWSTYRKDILELLMLLCEDSTERLPHLRRLHYVSNNWSRRWEQYKPPEKPFEKLQAIFSEKGIEFYAGQKMLTHT